MTDDIQAQMLEHLRYMRGRFDSIDERTGRLEFRLGAIEGHFVNMLHSGIAQNAELDRINRRLDRIERQLDLRDMEP